VPPTAAWISVFGSGVGLGGVVLQAVKSSEIESTNDNTLSRGRSVCFGKLRVVMLITP
jgi:hypothetical protein